MNSLMNSDFALVLDGLGFTYLGNTLSQWVFALCLGVLIFSVSLGIKHFTLNKLKRNRINNFMLEILSAGSKWFFLAIALFASSRLLKLGNFEQYIEKFVVIAIFWQFGIWSSILFTNFLRRLKNSETSSEFIIFNFAGRLLIWALIILLMLDNLGIKVVPLMAGLGVGGIAIALAVQKILGDLFASISIMLDKPFEMGDMVVVGEHSGFIEQIGLKTTRMRSITGEQLIISNSDLLESRIRNYKRMQERRVNLFFGVTHQTSRENLEKIPQIIKEIVDNQKNARFDRAHLQKIGDFSMIYECVYWSTSPDYKTFMDVQQSVNLAMIGAFAEKGISFAHPTQTLIVNDGV